MKTRLGFVLIALTTIAGARAQWSVDYMSTPRYNMGVAQFASGAVFVTDSWERYDATNHVWSNGLLSDARISIAAAQSGTKAYFAGGKKGLFTDYVYVNNVDIYDDVTHAWTKNTLSVAREIGGTGALDTKVFFAGGRSAITMYNTVDIFDSITGKKTRGKLSQARTDIAVGAAGGKIVFAGGW